MTAQQQDDRASHWTSDPVQVAAVGLIILVVGPASFLALALALITSLALTNYRKVWAWVATSLLGSVYLLIRLTNYTENPQWLTETGKVPWRVFTEWKKDPGPSLGEVIDQTPHVSPWLISSILVGIGLGGFIRVLFDIGFFSHQRFPIYDRANKDQGDELEKPQTPGWEHHP